MTKRYAHMSAFMRHYSVYLCGLRGYWWDEGLQGMVPTKSEEYTKLVDWIHEWVHQND